MHLLNDTKALFVLLQVITADQRHQTRMYSRRASRDCMEIMLSIYVPLYTLKGFCDY